MTSNGSCNPPLDKPAKAEVSSEDEKDDHSAISEEEDLNGCKPTSKKRRASDDDQNRLERKRAYNRLNAARNRARTKATLLELREEVTKRDERIKELEAEKALLKQQLITVTSQQFDPSNVAQQQALLGFGGISRPGQTQTLQSSHGFSEGRSLTQSIDLQTLLALSMVRR